MTSIPTKADTPAEVKLLMVLITPVMVPESIGSLLNAIETAGGLTKLTPKLTVKNNDKVFKLKP